MNNIDTLKNELILQKQKIEEKGGVVQVSNNNPSPSEITAGIGTIVEQFDMSDATATEADVVEGKTYYDSERTLKTGTRSSFSIDDYIKLALYDPDSEIHENINFTLPAGTKVMRQNLFACCPHYLNITLNPEIEFIRKNINVNGYGARITNLHEMQNLKTLEDYALYNFTVNINDLPDCLEYAGFCCLNRAVYDQQDITFPSKLTYLGGDICRIASSLPTRHVGVVNFNNAPITYIGTYFLSNVICNSPIVFPNKTTTIMDYCGYGGSCKAATFPAGLTKLGIGIYSLRSDQSSNTCELEYIKFLGETPPTISSSMLKNALTNNTTFKGVYVPDNSLEAYKAIKNLSHILGYIKPMSQFQ